MKNKDSVTKITHLDEGLHFTPLRQLLRAHPLRDLQRITLDTGDDGMRVGALLGALIQLFNNDNFLACLATLKEDRNLSRSSAVV